MITCIKLFQTATLKTKGDELFSSGQEREYESLRKTMEYEKEKYNYLIRIII